MLKAAYFVIVLAIFIDSINAGSASVGRGASAPWVSNVVRGMNLILDVNECCCLICKVVWDAWWKNRCEETF